MTSDIYWFITVFAGWSEKTGNPICARTWGFYKDKQEALTTLHNNINDLFEGVYSYAVLEPYYEGISGYTFEYPRQFFKYNQEKDSYFEIAEPEAFAHSCSFAIG